MSAPSPFRAIGPVEWVALITLSVIWGGSYLFMKIAVGYLPVFTIVFLRVALGGMTLGAILMISFHSFDIPKEGQIVRNITPNDLLSTSFGFIPGKSLVWDIVEGHVERVIEDVVFEETL